MVVMGRSSNPRLMARVLEAIGHLGESKGSSARQVVELVRQGNTAPPRNLAMQVTDCSLIIHELVNSVRTLSDHTKHVGLEALASCRLYFG